MKFEAQKALTDDTSLASSSRLSGEALEQAIRDLQHASKEDSEQASVSQLPLPHVEFFNGESPKFKIAHAGHHHDDRADRAAEAMDNRTDAEEAKLNPKQQAALKEMERAFLDKDYTKLDQLIKTNFANKDINSPELWNSLVKDLKSAGLRCAWSVDEKGNGMLSMGAVDQDDESLGYIMTFSSERNTPPNGYIVKMDSSGKIQSYDPVPASILFSKFSESVLDRYAA